MLHVRDEVQRGVADAHEEDARAGRGHDLRAAARHHGQPARARYVPLGRARPAGRRAPHQPDAAVRHLHQLPVAHVAREERLPVRREALDLRLLHLLAVERQHPGLSHEGQHERVVVRGAGLQRQRPHALDAGQVDGRLLLDADAVADDAQRAHLESACE